MSIDMPDRHITQINDGLLKNGMRSNRCGL